MVYEKVLFYCAQKGISVAAFERMCNLGNGTVSKWKVREPSFSSLMRIVSATGISLKEWIGDSYGY